MLFNNEARGKLLKGIKSLAEAVSATLGPKGRNVAIKKGDDIHITKDGVTVAKNIKLEDVYEDVGAQMIKEVASKTANIAGDGTTTSVILSSVIFEAGLQLMTAGYNPIDIKKSLEVESKKVIEYLEKISKPVNNDILSIAKISSNDDLEVAQLIADALHEVGENGIVTVEESHNVQTYLEYKKGMQFDRGYISPYFCTNESEQIVEFENPYILTYEGEISNIKDILSILEDVAATKRPLLIICDEISDDVLSTLVINNIKGVIKTAVVKSPMYGDNRKKMVEDIAHITGGVYVDNVVYSLDKIKKDHLGGCSKVIINNEHTTIIDGFCLEDELQSRIDSIVHSISKEKSSQELEKLNERLAKLTGGIAVIYIGAQTESELKEKKDRVDDAVSATKAAIEKGVIPGGGVSLLRAISVLDLNTTGGIVLNKALQAPIKKIIENSGLESATIINKVLENDCVSYGYNAKTETYEDFLMTGIIDPLKVTSSALLNSISIANLLITTECIIINKNNND